MPMVTAEMNRPVRAVCARIGWPLLQDHADHTRDAPSSFRCGIPQFAEPVEYDVDACGRLARLRRLHTQKAAVGCYAERREVAGLQPIRSYVEQSRRADGQGRARR